MKNFFRTFFVFCLALVCFLVFSACGGDDSDVTTPKVTTKKVTTTKFDDSIVWKNAGKGSGAFVPEPQHPYEVKASRDWLSVEVYDITEEDFYSYVDACRYYGFLGMVGSASSPDLYLMDYNSQDYYLEVFYYESEHYFSIFVRPPSQNTVTTSGSTTTFVTTTVPVLTIPTTTTTPTTTAPVSTTAYASEFVFYPTDDDFGLILSEYNGTSDEIVIPSTYQGKPVVAIGEWAFAGAPISSVTIPYGIMSIGYGAFTACDLLETVSIPASVTTIEGCAFEGCGLTSVYIPSSVKTIGYSAFSLCTDMESLVISDGVISIGESAFASCGSLISVSIPSSVLYVGMDAFSNCVNLTSAVIGDGVRTIESSTFWGCRRLTDLVIGENVGIIDICAFYECGITSVTIPAAVVHIGESAFLCYDLCSVTFKVTEGWSADGTALSPFDLADPLSAAELLLNFNYGSSLTRD